MYDLLKGLRVVEGASFIAAPSCSLHLLQFGADVIRFDQIGGGPDARRWPRAQNGVSLYWEGLNKGKRSIAIDLGRPEGRELAVALATAPGPEAGLFVTNYPATGFLSHERLAARRPDMITVRVMGWPDGRTAVDYTVNAVAGLPLMTGPSELDPAQPVNHVLPAWDLITGAYAAFALLAAERHRRATGEGQEVRLPLVDLAAATLGHVGQIGEVVLGGRDRPRHGNEIFGAFGRDFVTADATRLMVVAITPRQWRGLLEVLGIEAEVAALEAEFGVDFSGDEGQRFAYRDQLYPLVAQAMASHTEADLTARFDAVGVCWSRYGGLLDSIRSLPDFVTANPLFSATRHPGGEYPTPGAAATLKGGPPRAAPRPAPRIGQNTDEVLSDILHLSAKTIADLHDRGIVAGAVPAD